MLDFLNTESWEDKVSNKLSNSKLASKSRPSYTLQFLLRVPLKEEYSYTAVALEGPFKRE